MFPEATDYDEMAKRILGLGKGPLLLWLTRFTAKQMRFKWFLPTELTIPGMTQRICDAIAFLEDLKNKNVPVAGLVEIQTTPDLDIVDRLGLAGHILRLTDTPSGLPGDRWSFVGIVLNLTGKASSSREMCHSGSGWALWLRERNLAACKADKILEKLARGKIPDSVSAFVSLMKNGGKPDTIARWMEVSADWDPQRRREFAAANVVFAELTKCKEAWQKAVEGLKMGESPYLNTIRTEGRTAGLAEGRTAGLAEGLAEGHAESLLRMLRRLGTVPSELEAAIRACKDPAKLLDWQDLAFARPSLEEFRRNARI